MIELKESAFDWVVLPKELDKKYLVKVVFKTPAVTDHTKDTTIPEKDRKIRHYTETEQLEAARSMIHKPLDINHEIGPDGNFKRIPNSFVYDSQFNKTTGNCECIIYVPHDSIIKAFREGLIKEVSPESLALRGEKQVDANTVEPEGLVFTGLALIVPTVGESAGDPNTSVQLIETVRFPAYELLETTVAECTPEKECHPEKECNPVKECNELTEMQKIEKMIGLSLTQYKESEAIKDELKKAQELLAKVTAQNAEITESLKKLQETINKHPDEVAKAAKEAKEQGRKEGIKEVVNTVEKALPPKDVLFSERGIVRLNQQVRKAIYPYEEATK